MLAIERWAEGRPIIVSMLAHSVAASAAECHSLIAESRKRWLLSREEALAIEPSAWERLYTQPQRVEGTALLFLFAPNEPQYAEEAIDAWPICRGRMKASLNEELREILTSGISRRKLELGCAYVRRIYKWVHVPLMHRMLLGDVPPPENFRQWLRQPEFVFLMSVALPGWMEYQQTPWKLFERARQSDFESLEKLVRLDPEVDKHPELRKIVWRMQRNQARYRLLQTARLHGETKKTTLVDVKYLLGGLLMKWTHELHDMIVRGNGWFERLREQTPPEHHARVRAGIRKYRQTMERTALRYWLKSPDIKSLFDALAQDTRGELVDRDFSGQPNSIYKRFDAKAKLWMSWQDADNFRAA